MLKNNASLLSVLLGSQGHPISRLNDISVEQAAHIERLILEVPPCLKEPVARLDIATLSGGLFKIEVNERKLL
jgi:hypothetical protein